MFFFHNFFSLFDLLTFTIILVYGIVPTTATTDGHHHHHIPLAPHDDERPPTPQQLLWPTKHHCDPTATTITRTDTSTTTSTGPNDARPTTTTTANEHKRGPNDDWQVVVRAPVLHMFCIYIYDLLTSVQVVYIVVCHLETCNALPTSNYLVKEKDSDASTLEKRVVVHHRLGHINLCITIK